MRAAALALAALLLVSACGAGQGEAPGASQPRNEGGNADVRQVYVRNAYLLREGQGMALHVVLINGGPQADRLEQITTSAGTPTINGTVDLPPGAFVGADRALATVTGVADDVHGFVQTTFTFTAAGSATIQVPVKN